MRGSCSASGLAAHLKPGTVVMVSSTIASADAQAIAEALAEYQLLMLDAPVSGGAVAAAGDMTVMASGKRCRLCPPRAGAGRRGRQSLPHRERHWSWLDGKIIHQLLAGVHIAVAAEAMALAARAGIPLETMYDVVTHAAVILGCLRIACSTSSDGDYSPNPLSIFLSKISGW